MNSEMEWFLHRLPLSVYSDSGNDTVLGWYWCCLGSAVGVLGGSLPGGFLPGWRASWPPVGATRGRPRWCLHLGPLRVLGIPVDLAFEVLRIEASLRTLLLCKPLFWRNLPWFLWNKGIPRPRGRILGLE